MAVHYLQIKKQNNKVCHSLQNFTLIFDFDTTYHRQAFSITLYVRRIKRCEDIEYAGRGKDMVVNIQSHVIATIYCSYYCYICIQKKFNSCEINLKPLSLIK